MTSKEFKGLLSRAISGDNDALADIAVLYMPLINRYSHIDGKLDEDLRQNILLELVRSILVLFTCVTLHSAVLLGNPSTLNKRGEHPPWCSRTLPATLSVSDSAPHAPALFSFPAVMAFHEALTILQSDPVHSLWASGYPQPGKLAMSTHMLAAPA